MKNILSIDGGGVKTYMPLRLLNEIENRTKIPISELFDYFAGVSAGALICSLLLIKNKKGKQKYSTGKIIQIFETQCKTIFNYTYLSWASTGFGLFDSTYKSINIKKSLDNYFTTLCLNELIKPITIISFDLITNTPIYFNRNTFPSVKITDCLMATTAAPTYFSPYELSINKNKYLFIDGGVVNNPIEQCFLDSYNYYNIINKNKSTYTFYTLSLGTGYYDIDYSSFNFGKVGWANKIIDILFSANMCEENYQLKLIEKFMPGNKLNRIDFKLKKKINLDDTTSFNEMKVLMDDWIKNNNDMINKLCDELTHNYNNKI
jgi:patatin-like phospholipase/acyl hydrolase